MNNTKKISIGLVAAFVLMAQPGSVSAIQSAAELQAKISALRSVHVELAAEVKAGTISKEEAQKQWQELIRNARAEKEKFFKEKIEMVKEKYQEFAQKNPQRAAVVKERIDASLHVRNEIAAERAELRQKLDAGLISQREALSVKKNLLQEKHSALKDIRKEIHAKSAAKAYVKLDGIEGESQGYVKLDDVKGESRGNVKSDSVKGESRTHLKADSLKAETSVGFDPLGLDALEVFPGVKANLKDAAEIRARQEARAVQMNGKRDMHLQGAVKSSVL